MTRRRAAILIVCVACLLAGCTPAEGATVAKDEITTDDAGASEGRDPSDDAKKADGTDVAADPAEGGSLLDYCTERQRDFLKEAKEEIPVELVFHDWVEAANDYATVDEALIAEILRALECMTVASKSSEVSTQARGVTITTASGDAFCFWFDGERFEGADGATYELSGDRTFWELLYKIREGDPE